jgi:hypothetical protein
MILATGEAGKLYDLHLADISGGVVYPQMYPQVGGIARNYKKRHKTKKPLISRLFVFFDTEKLG